MPDAADFVSPARRTIVGDQRVYAEQDRKKAFQSYLSKKLKRMQDLNRPIVFKEASTKRTIKDGLSIRNIVDGLMDNRIEL